MAKFHKSGEIFFVNPETDYFNKFGGDASVEFINKTHPHNSYDLVHIHFSFDKLSVFELENLLNYFDNIKKPVVWTCHSRESQREKDIGNGELQKMLWSRAKAIITPTQSCKDWLVSSYGTDKSIDVIPLGYIVDPNTLYLYRNELNKKEKTNFVYLIGDMRQNKEIYFSIDSFLKSLELSDCILMVIARPRFISKENIDSLDEERKRIMNNILSSPRIKLNIELEISNEALVEIFCKSHVCMLPYLWGTHSGQVELSKDCGCYPVISNVGFYEEQSDQVIEFCYNDNLSVFVDNFVQALKKAKEMPLLAPNSELRKYEFKAILQQHLGVYRGVLKN